MKLLIFLCVALAAPIAFADGYGGGTAIDADSDSNAQSGSFSGANTLVDRHDRSYVTNHGTDLSRGVPSVIAPSNSVGLQVCSATGSVGVGWSGLGFSIGLPFSDSSCNRRQDAITARNLGEALLGKEVMCENKRFFRASYRANRPCYPDEKLLKSLSDGERGMYEEMLAQRKQQQNVAAAVLESQQQGPISAEEMVRRGHINLEK